MFIEILQVFPQPLQVVGYVVWVRCGPTVVGCTRFSLLLQPVYTHNPALQMVSVEFRVLAASCIKETGYLSRKSCFNAQTCLCISIRMFLIKVSILRNCK
jgi:hypothetical protein